MPSPFLVVLGVAQDGGYPQAGCQGECCAAAQVDPARRRHAACLAVVDPASRQRWLLDCTPDLRPQLRLLDRTALPAEPPGITGICLTHAHFGHYTGLMFLGHEGIGTRDMPVYAMPRMRRFLEDNGPWSQLVRLGNIDLRPLADGRPEPLNERLRVTPFLVPHRDEYSEVVGFRVEGPRRSAAYLPDIDKWERWETPIESVIADHDAAFLDGTFFADGELPGRNMADIPHPLMIESLERFSALPTEERRKVRFLHFNHTNPVLDDSSPAAEQVRCSGCQLAKEGSVFEL